MNTHRNRVQLIGRLGSAPETFNFDSGKSVTKFSLATSTSYKDQKDNWQEKTEWHHIVAWGKLGETLKSKVAKGDEVLLVGKLTYNHYENKNGEKRYITEVEVHEFSLLKQVKKSEESMVEN